MSGFVLIDQGDGRFAITGDLTFATIGRQAAKSLAFLRVTQQVTVDLAQVNNADSAGLALMIEWLKFARSHQTQLLFLHIPKTLLNLASLGGLDATLFSDGDQPN